MDLEFFFQKHRRNTQRYFNRMQQALDLKEGTFGADHPKFFYVDGPMRNLHVWFQPNVPSCTSCGRGDVAEHVRCEFAPLHHVTKATY